MKSLYLVAFLHCVCFVCAGKTWTDAKDMRKDVENIVLQRAKFLQQQYEGVKEVRVRSSPRPQILVSSISLRFSDPCPVSELCKCIPFQ